MLYFCTLNFGLEDYVASKTVSIKSVTPKGDIETVIGRMTDIEVTPSINYLNTLDDFNCSITQGTFSEPIIRNCILLSNKLYLMGGVSSTVIDLQVTMANTIMEIETDNEELNKIMAHIMDWVNYNNPRTMMGRRQLHEEMFLGLLLDGNVFPYEYWETRKIKGKSYFLPMGIMPLNPLSISIKPTKDLMGEIVTYRNGYNNYLGNSNINKSSEGEQIIRKMNMHRITRRGRQYFFWGVPFLTRAFPALAAKERLKQLDEFTTQGLISLITIFSLYDDKAGTVADSQVVNAFANMLDGRPGQARYLTWGGQVKMIQAGPNGEILKYDEKYHSKDKDIAEALGCPMFLVNGQLQGGTNGADYSVKPFKTNLEDCQNNIGDWWKYLTYKIAELNNLEVNMVEYRFSAVNLDNDAVLISKIDNMRDRGLLSDTSAALKLGVSSKLEQALVSKERKEQEDNEDYKFGTPPPVPFQGPTAAGNPTQTTKNGGNGRPKATEPTQTKDKVQKQNESQKRKVDVKANLMEISTDLVEAMLNNISQSDDVQKKLEFPLITACQVANLFCSKISDEIDSPKEFFEVAMAKCNEFSIDIQQDIIAGSVSKDKVNNMTSALVDDLYTKYLAKLIGHTVEVK